ncbi:unnamed protein product [Paramecium pentaurelia]|uniref:Ubiquitin-fold modifier-conjugating enzyme 1 n=1 Tax=Paramecium pentaurelia TaxID=43138 RepID=A0A8S1V181_9CILI|nr:unnamed protein product [Paramecium pentaurelia]
MQTQSPQASITISAGPRDPQWIDRLKEEYSALINYIKNNKSEDNDWVKLEPANKECTNWKGKCWVVHNLIRYEFDFQFEIPPTYPLAPIEIEIPSLDGLTPKMYRGGKICIDIHFAPLWQKNAPKFGIVHALQLALAPWLAAEIPVLIEEGKIKKD